MAYVARDGGVELQMNVVVPQGMKEGEKRACVVCIHGGGWAAGKRQELDELTRRLAAQGFVAATVSYRFAPAARSPAQVNDVAEAVRFLRVNAARFGIDPDRIGAVGFSAGGHLAMMLGVGDAGDGLGIEGADGQPSGKVNAVVSFFGPTLLGANDFAPTTTKILDGLIGADAEGRTERAKAASPVTYLSKGDAPMLLLQGTADPLVPATQATLMVEAMAKAGVPGRAEIIAGAGHGWGGPELERTLRVTTEFFREHLREKPGAAGPGGAMFTVNCDEAPDLAEWGERAKKVCEEWYPRLIKEFGSEGFKPRESVSIVFKKTMRVPAATGGGTISVNAEYVRGHKGDMGMMVHELFHVVQAYPRQKADMGWLTEGLADYVRFWQYEPQTKQRQIDKEKASWRNSYRVTAAFLGWLESKAPGSVVKLNARMRKGGVDESVFEDVTGKGVAAWWQEFVEAGAPSSPVAVNGQRPAR
ncbi:MAG TPA: alpha/beta fold hydrolase [Phycisphaerales bacterium]|nr:alpha/beta fold hydrolase [Phycisphaerales bacterium]